MDVFLIYALGIISVTIITPGYKNKKALMVGLAILFLALGIWRTQIDLQKIADESFDLIYLDPPFNSNRNYNVLFKEGLQDSPAQVHAFEDSWHWSHESVENFEYLVIKTNENISNLMLALEKTIGHNDMLAYLTMMAVWLIELHRVLKKTGSL